MIENVVKLGEMYEANQPMSSSAGSSHFESSRAPFFGGEYYVTLVFDAQIPVFLKM
jgi:hypothetical protein